ncbi:conserved hypothetical protein [Thermococcus sp. AM4]|nr:conserved hypothetical protein [Thermococcus sp. AM4]
MFLIAALLSGAFFTMNYYQTVTPVMVEFKLQLFMPPGMGNTSSTFDIVQVAEKDLVLPAAGTYGVSLSGNCTLYVQTDSGLLRNPNTITVTNRGIRVILLNQTTDVVVKFIPQRRIDYTTPVFLLVVGSVMGYAVRVFKFE